jgi:hypothetical protein
MKGIMKLYFLVKLSVLLMLAFSLCSWQSYPVDEVPAFPGAQGAGKYSTGGRGGEVVLVTNLNDEGPGSLRKAIRKHGPRIIVFRVAGNIELKSSLDVNNGDVTIAGQTAPGDGICLTGHAMKVKGDNVIVRYLRVRPGDTAGIELDAFTCKDNRNVIIDHCSFSWGTDEVCSVYDNENTTLQYCIVSESFNNSVHHKGEHGYGGIWGGKTTSFIGNLLAHHVSRNPRLQGSRYHKQPEKERSELVNNIIYNWRSKCIYAGEEGNYNIIGNYFKPGPATEHSAVRELLEPYAPFGNFYIANNALEGSPEITEDNLKGISIDADPEPNLFVDAPFRISDFSAMVATTAYTQILEHVGAGFRRDSVDLRIVVEVRSGTATYGNNGIIVTQEDVGGWPQLMPGTIPGDRDGDGMPDEWEEANGLDPDCHEDHNQYTLSNAYTNVEVWINHLT